MATLTPATLIEALSDHPDAIATLRAKELLPPAEDRFDAMAREVGAQLYESTGYPICASRLRKGDMREGEPSQLSIIATALRSVRPSYTDEEYREWLVRLLEAFGLPASASEVRRDDDDDIPAAIAVLRRMVEGE